MPLNKLKVSSELKDLLSQLLEKDPVKRITYPELVNHPYWSKDYPKEIKEMKKLVMPKQP